MFLGQILCMHNIQSFSFISSHLILVQYQKYIYRAISATNSLPQAMIINLYNIHLFIIHDFLN